MPRDFIARTWAYFITYCPDTDSCLCCQHPSCFFTDIDRCISISVHLISTRTAINSFGRISALFLSFRIYCIFCSEGKKRSTFNNSFALPGKLIIQHIPEHPASIILYTFPKMQILAHRFHINTLSTATICGIWSIDTCLAHCLCTTVSVIWSAYFLMAPGNCLFLPHITAAPFYTSTVYALLASLLSFFLACLHLDLFWKHCHPLHRIINPKYSGVAVILICYLVLQLYPSYSRLAKYFPEGSILTVTDFRRQFSADSLCFFMDIHFNFGSSGFGYLLPEYFR